MKEKFLNDYDKKWNYYDRNGVCIGRSREEEDGFIEKDLKVIGGYRCLLCFILFYFLIRLNID